MSNLEEIQDFLWVLPDLLTSGQPFAHQFVLLKDAGVHSVINLALSSSADAIFDEGDIVQKLGMGYVHIPVEWQAPLPEDLLAFFDAMEQLQGQKVLVHCARNKRVSCFVMLYRVLRLGTPLDVCQADMQKIWQPDIVWQEFIDTSLDGGSA
jgi:protein tyrosine phosphatase (PTP) superfamily phosphohydrolase (DUF442 family)